MAEEYNNIIPYVWEKHFFAHQDIVFRHNDALLEMLEFAQMCEEESVFGVAGAK